MVERILVVGPKDTISMVDDLAPKGFEIVKALRNSPEMKAALPGTDYFVGFIQQYVTPQLFKDAPKLKLIQMLSAGYDRADLEAARASKVPLCNNGGANSVAVSEHALLLMLAVSRRLITQHTNVTAGRWHGNAPPTVHQVRDKVLGIVGLGTIGKKVARLAQAFGMVVHYYDIVRLSEAEEDALGVRFRLLPELLRHADIRQVGVIALADERLGEKSCACFVSRRPDLGAAALRRFLREQGVADYKVPDRFERLPSLPLTAVGKIDKHRLRALVEAASTPSQT